jgi:inner membrane protease ATP23
MTENQTNQLSTEPPQPPGSSAPPKQEDAPKLVDEAALRLFPERRGNYLDRSFFARAFMGDESRVRRKCERQIIKAVEEAPLVKLMVHALRSYGCPVDLRRHVTCEFCSKEVTGGYDPVQNQIVVCCNTSTFQTVQGILAHELLHMFDHCRSHMDFRNPHHVACSEVRAANLFHCSIISGMLSGTVTPVSLAQAHARCVKQKAVASLLGSFPDMPQKEGWRITDQVFDRCYNDLEPVGRRVRARSDDPQRAYRERFLYGYD